MHRGVGGWWWWGPCLGLGGWDRRIGWVLVGRRAVRGVG